MADQNSSISPRLRASDIFAQEMNDYLHRKLPVETRHQVEGLDRARRSPSPTFALEQAADHEQHLVQRSSSLKDHARVSSPIFDKSMIRQQYFSILDISKTWWKELAACLIIIGTLLTLVMLLLRYEDKPTPNWPSYVSINTLISVLVNVLKSAMILILAEGLGQLRYTWFLKPRPLDDLQSFQDAPRSFLASCKLFARLRGELIAAGAGALILISTIALGPLSQQTIRYYTCTQSSSSQIATIAKTNSYGDVGSHLGALESGASVGLQNAFYNGLFYPDSYTPSWVDFDCPSGHCAFPTFSTFSLCSRCVERSDQVQKNCSYSSTAFNGTIIDNCLYHEPGQPANGVQMDTWYSSPTPSLNIGACAKGDFGPSLEVPLSISEGFCFYSIGQSTQPDKCSSLPQCLIAASCNLYPCVRTIQASIANGTLQEKVLSTRPAYIFPTVAVSEPANIIVNTSCIPDHLREQLRPWLVPIPGDANFTVWDYLLEYPSLSDNGTHPSVSIPIPPAECSYNMTREAFEALGGLLYDSLLGNLTCTGGAMYGAYELQTLYNNGDFSFESLNRTISNIADSISAFMRRNPGNFGPASSPTSVAGDVLVVDTCIAIRWGWVGYPLVCGLSTIVFFTLVCWNLLAQGGWRYNWKSSIVAFILHCGGYDLGRSTDVADRHGHVLVQQSGGQSAGDLGRLEAMEELGKHIKLQFSRTDDGHWGVNKLD